MEDGDVARVGSRACRHFDGREYRGPSLLDGFDWSGVFSKVCRSFSRPEDNMREVEGGI